MVRQRVRIRFRKQGDLRWIGHRDFVRSLERWFRRAGLALGMSEGFHPKPRMSFPSALAVGIEGLEEAMEIELAETCTADELRAKLVPHAVPGLVLSSVEILPPSARKAQLRGCTYEAEIPAPRCAETARRVGELLAETSHAILRPHRRNTVDLRRSVEELSLEHGVLRMRMRADREGSAGPRDLLQALGLGDLEPTGCRLTRTCVELEP